MRLSAVTIFALIVMLLAGSGCVSAPGTPAPASATPSLQEVLPHYVIGVDENYPPFTYRDSGGNFTGFDIEAARWIAARQEFSAEFVAVPWDAILPALEDGSIDMVYSGMTITAERQERVRFTGPYYTVNQSIAARQGSGITMDDLYAGRLRIGAQAGTPGAAWAMDNLVIAGKMPAGDLLLYPDITTLSENLSAGAIDVSVIEAPVQERAVAGRPLFIIGEIFTNEQYAVAVRKTDPELLALMDDGLEQLMEDPHWQQLLEKYGLE